MTTGGGVCVLVLSDLSMEDVHGQNATSSWEEGGGGYSIFVLSDLSKEDVHGQHAAQPHQRLLHLVRDVVPMTTRYHENDHCQNLVYLAERFTLVT